MTEPTQRTQDAPKPTQIKESWGMQIPKSGDCDVFEKIAIPIEDPGPDEVAIDVKACGVNFADCLMRMGLYPEAPKVPFIPGYEVAGTVRALGKNVKDYQIGDRVMAATYFGGYAGHVVVEQDKVLPIPEHLSFEEGAGLLVNFMTAWVALHEMSRIRAGDHVLIHGVAGGVGLAALQIAKNAGCKVFGTAGSDEKLEHCRTLGLDYGVNYRKTSFVDDIRLNVEKRPLDVVLDPVGGSNVAKSRKLIKPTGRIVIYGMSQAVSGEKPNKIKQILTGLKMMNVNVLGLFSQNHGVYGLNVLRLWPFPVMRRVGLELLKEFEAQRLHCTLDQSFPLNEVNEAHRYLQQRKNKGKVVLTL